MATIRPIVSVYDINEKRKVIEEIPMAEVFKSPIRNDVIQIVHTNMSKNARHAYAVKYEAGYETSAESWGTGRAVARIPRVAGGGTHRAGQAAFGNMCRGGGMFNPTKVWRRWGRRVNLKEKRYAVCSALAASACTPLVLARGHRIGNVSEIPLVIDDAMESITKTKEAVKLLRNVGLKEELQRLMESKAVRAGKGKRRNRKYKTRRGPLIIYNEDKGVKRAFRNIPGIDLCRVDRLNLLKLAPGASLGRFIIWTKSAFQKLDVIYGRVVESGITKKNYVLPKPLCLNADIFRIINSDKVQSVLRPKRKGCKKRTQHKNPLKNYAVRCRLNPAYKLLRMTLLKKQELAEKEKKKNRSEKRLKTKKLNKMYQCYYDTIEQAIRRKKRKEERKAKSRKAENLAVVQTGGDE